MLNQLEAEEAQARTERVEPIRKIVFACDAGMGSSAMGASVLRNKLKQAGFRTSRWSMWPSPTWTTATTWW